MKSEIVDWIKGVCKLYGMEAIYIPAVDVYSLRIHGKGVQNFNTKIFYQLPKKHREKMLLPLIKKGVAHNLGEKKLNLYQQRNIGKRII